jgi:hypothetical protein
MCGTRTDVCNDSCQFTAGSCAGEHGACDPAVTPQRIVPCGKCNRGSRIETCTSACTFAPQACSDPDADVDRVTNATVETVSVVDSDENTQHGTDCAFGNVRETITVENLTPATGSCESLGFARLLNSSGSFELVSDPKWCGMVLFTLGTVSCKVTVTQRRVCP